MADLRLTFQDLYNQVAKFLGTYGSSGPSGDDLTDAKDIVHSAYRRFINSHNWTFLKPPLKIVTVSGTWIYDLPDDFSAIIGLINFDADDGYPPLDERSVDDIMEMRVLSDYTSYPMFYATRAGVYTPETGQRWEIIFYPTPGSAYTLNSRYKIFPKKLSATSDLPIGLPETDEVLKALCLAEAESNKDEFIDVQETKAIRLLMQAIQADKLKEPKTLGYNANYPGMTAREIHRGSYRISDVEYDTD